jgi:hypothetical protein
MPDELTPQQNTGVLIGQRPSDYVGGTLDYKVRVPDGDWRPFLVKEEKQFSDNADTMGCVSFSANNSLEIQTKQQTGQEVNYSDRFLAKMSGTTLQGNYLYKVADTLRNIGIVTEAEYPTPSSYNWDSYYAPIDQAVISKAQKLDVAYEWVNRADFKHHLKHAPLQIIITEQNPNHAVVLVAIEGDTAYYFDTYPPYLKTIKLSSIYPNALKIVLNASMTTIEFVHKAGTPEYGFLEKNEYAEVYRKAASEVHLAVLAEVYKLNILTPDHKIDFSKAREITL